MPRTLSRPSSPLKPAIDSGGLMSEKDVTRREILRLALGAPLLALAPGVCQAQGSKEQRLDLQALKNAPTRIVPAGAALSVEQVKLVRKWNGALCRARLINRGRKAVRVKEV